MDVDKTVRLRRQVNPDQGGLVTFISHGDKSGKVIDKLKPAHSAPATPAPMSRRESLSRQYERTNSTTLLTDAVNTNVDKYLNMSLKTERMLMALNTGSKKISNMESRWKQQVAQLCESN